MEKNLLGGFWGALVSSLFYKLIVVPEILCAYVGCTEGNIIFVFFNLFWITVTPVLLIILLTMYYPIECYVCKKEEASHLFYNISFFTFAIFYNLAYYCFFFIDIIPQITNLLSDLPLTSVLLYIQVGLCVAASALVLIIRFIIFAIKIFKENKILGLLLLAPNIIILGFALFYILHK
jgi:hypothetical protein